MSDAGKSGWNHWVNGGLKAVTSHVAFQLSWQKAAFRSSRSRWRISFRPQGVDILLVGEGDSATDSVVCLIAAAIGCPATFGRVAMSTQERACCRMMKNQCGQMGMPASHGCCQKAPPSVHDNALDTEAVTFHPVAVPVIWLAPSELVNPASGVTGWVEHPDYSFPS
jgi:hypothetical protein